MITCLPAAPSFVDELGRATAGHTLGLVYLGLVPTAIAFGTWAYALARMDRPMFAVAIISMAVCIIADPTYGIIVGS